MTSSNSSKPLAGWDAQRDADEDFHTLGGDVCFRSKSCPKLAGPALPIWRLKWGGPRLVRCWAYSWWCSSCVGCSSAAVALLRAEPEVPVDVPDEDLTPEEQQKRMRREIERSIASDPAALGQDDGVLADGAEGVTEVAA